MGLKFQRILLGLIVQLLVVDGEFFRPFNVSYDGRAMIIDGERRMLISGGIHYPRATPEMWPDLISKSKEGGVDVIETYVFWNGHEPVRGQYVFEGRYDIVKFVKQVGASGLYLFLRIGPYVCAEWNFGGFPVWLRDVPGIEFRTDNTPFKEEMERFVRKIVDLMREESLFSWQGGPIIMLQIENEYGNMESFYGPKGKNYMRWAAKMAVGLGAGVPWVMCKQVDAPEDIIDTCNGYYCDGFKPNSNKKPTIWTEEWDGWYTCWGDRVPHRPAQDIAFAVARFFQRGGSFQNYYMYFGGTNFGRSAGGPNYITSYDYDAPLDEYGLLRQPKWGHLKDLHAAIKLCESALIAVNSPQYIKLGPKQEAHIYEDKGHRCSAFLANIDEHNSATVRFRNQAYTLPPWSVSILPDCRNTAFNTAKIGVQTSIKTVGVDAASYLHVPSSLKLMSPYEVEYISKTWEFVKEPIGVWSASNFTYQGILEHLNVTKDKSDYLWYATRIYISNEDIKFWEENQISPVLTIDSMRDLVYIFVNGQFTGSARGKWIKVTQPVNLKEGYNDILLLSQTVGLQNYGAFLEKDGAGFRGQIKLTGCKIGDLDITEFKWTYQVGLKGEYLKIFAIDEKGVAEWSEFPLDATATRFSWYKTYFDIPGGLDPIAIDLSSMGKGQAWVNGHHIGRYWTLYAPKDGCQTCDYRGAYDSAKCVTNCGEPTQSWYHIPRSWAQASNNLLVIFEETLKSPFEISIKSHFTETLCAMVSEDHFPPLHAWSLPETRNGTIVLNNVAPEMYLHCDAGNTISSIKFASYGTPQGSCQKFSRGNCHAPISYSVLSQACVGRQNCSISVSNDVFGDPCRGVVKTLSVEMKCSPSSSISSSLM
ncbi:beta galactosidase 9 [Perilla frutescens var. hirtella]|uniref:Beta-galactosidase n=1 Tax=Perilla frutescens var. hirtella TaxID=608512 RepID=A0AAD4PA41_PERFH|nr:beta galactosidase 9 [Perilla frutescens var. hirtella]